MLVVVALPARAQTADISAIMARMQEIIREMQTLQGEFTQLSQSLTGGTGTPVATETVAPTGSVLGAATTVLQEEAVYGATNDTVERIQKLLATDPLLYPDGIVSGFFGPKTQEAIKNLQARFGMNPVGVVGPSTATLIMEYFLAYPGGSYPTEVLKTRPTARVAGAQTSTPTPAPVTPTPTSVVSGTNPIERIFLTRDGDETIVRVTLKAGGAFGLIADTTDKDELVEAIAERGKLREADVVAAIDMSDVGSASRDRRDRDDEDEYDDDDAEEAIDEARSAIRQARAAIRAAEQLDGDVSEAEELYDDARNDLERAEEDFDDDEFTDAYKRAQRAIDRAEEAEELADEAAEIDEAMADDMIDEADDAIDDADDRIDAARADGRDVDAAEDLLEQAKDELDDAEDDFDDEDWEDAYEKAERAKELAEAAEDEL